jgi:iron complex outermembrane recepter protein
MYAKSSVNDDFVNTDGSQANDGWQTTRAGFRIDRYSTDKDTLTLEGDVFNERASETNDANLFTAPYVNLLPTQINANEVDVLARWTHTTDARSDYALQFYYDDYNRQEYTLNTHTQSADLDFHDRFPLGERQEIIWGAGARMNIDSFVGNPGTDVTFDPTYENNYLLNAFAQDDVTLVDKRLHLYIGSKFEQNSYTGFEIQPTARLMWTPNDSNSVWGAVSRAVTTPTEQERSLSALITAPPAMTGAPPLLIGTEGNPDFQSQDLTAYELGYRVQATSTVSLDLATFYNWYDNLEAQLAGIPQLVPTPTPHLNLPITYVNGMAGPSYGAELSGTWQVAKNWRLMASYSYLISRFQSSVDSSGAVAVNGSSPQNQFQIHSYTDLTKSLEFNTGLYCVERLQGDETPAYYRWDMGLTWKPIDRLQISAVIQNLLNSRHSETTSASIYTVATEVPRSYYLSLTWTY